MLTSSSSNAPVSAKNLRFGIAAARYNEKLADGLVTHCVAHLVAAGAATRSIKILRVPGTFEVTAAANHLARTGRCHCVIGLGVLLEGQTRHAELIGAAVAHGLTTVSVQTGVPTIFGVVTANTAAQARVRCLGAKYNRGREAAEAAIAMADLCKRSRR